MAVALTPEKAAEVIIEERAPAYRQRRAPCLVVLNPDYSIVSAEPQLDTVLSEAGFSDRPPDRLPAEIERAAKELNAGHEFEGRGDGAALLPQLLVRSSILTGPSGPCVAVTLERLRSRDPLNGAAARFGLSPRELEVLKLVMSGFARKEIAERLFIAESTVGEYFKHLYAKIGVRNRSALFASVFQWPERVS